MSIYMSNPCCAAIVLRIPLHYRFGHHSQPFPPSICEPCTFHHSIALKPGHTRIRFATLVSCHPTNYEPVLYYIHINTLFQYSLTSYYSFYLLTNKSVPVQHTLHSLIQLFRSLHTSISLYLT